MKLSILATIKKSSDIFEFFAALSLLQKFFIEKAIDHNKLVDEAINLILDQIKK